MKISLIAILIFCFNVDSAELIEAATNVRSMGMGGAGTAISKGLDALFVNPAGLNKNQGIEFTAASPTITSNTDAWDTIQNYSEITGKELRDYLQHHVGKNYGLVLGSTTGISTKNFAAAFYVDMEVNASMHNLAFPELRTKSYYQYGLKIGTSYAFLNDDILKIGTAIKWINRRGLVDTATTETLLSLDTNEFIDWLDRRGTGYGLDLGMTFNLPVSNSMIKPAIALTWQDIFTTTIKSPSYGQLSPGRINDNLILGLATTFEFTALEINLAFDIKHLTERGIQIPLKLHMGAELLFPVIAIRGGYNQGYYTAGVAFDLFLFRINLLTYGEEMGFYAGQKEDRRYMLQITGSLNLFKDFKMEM